MTNSNSHSEMTGTGSGNAESRTEETFDLPDDFRSLVAMKAATEAKMTELQTTRAEGLRTRWTAEAAGLGMTPEEILHGVSKKKPRGRRSKRDE